MSARVPRTVKKTLISIVVMVVLFVVAGVIYVYITGRQQPTAPKINTKKEATPDILKPVAPAKNAPEGVAIESFGTPVKAGDNTSISTRSLAGSTCTIDVTYNAGVKSHDSGLVAKKTDIYGFTTWTWTVERTVSAGTYPVTVTCSYNGKSGMVIGNLQVTAT